MQGYLGKGKSPLQAFISRRTLVQTICIEPEDHLEVKINVKAGSRISASCADI